MNGRERVRVPPAADAPPLRDPRRGGDSQNDVFGPPTGSQMSRAERFEDEKRRIIHNCFGRKDKDAAFIESYITHIRVTEDAAYPSVPPPPTSQPENKKPRVIIVSVRRSGRVRMHKGRENQDGSFSIGKTWDLDELSMIQSFNNWTPTNPIEEQQKQWATNVGFTVTIHKPYYWHARSSKEKEFFIGSLLKIYRKYTGGGVPKLIGFDDYERQQLTGTLPILRESASGVTSDGGQLPPTESPQASRSQAPYSSRIPSREDKKDIRLPPPEDQPLRAKESKEQIKKPASGQRTSPHIPQPLGASKTISSVAPQDRHIQPPSRRGEPITGGIMMPKSPVAVPEAKGKDFLGDISTVPPLNQGGKPYGSSNEISTSWGLGLHPPPSRDGKHAPGLRPEVGTQGSASSSLATKRSQDSLRPTAAGSTSDNKSYSGQRAPVDQEGGRRIDETDSMTSASDAQNGSQGSTAMNGLAFNGPNDISSEIDDIETLPSLGPTESTMLPPSHKEERGGLPAEAATVTATTSPEPHIHAEEDHDVHRPGLGPMVKKKQGKDVAGAFRKAANAYGVFRPRPGGAGERLLAAAKKQVSTPEEPDGITSVVPAPSLLRPDSESTAPGVLSTDLDLRTTSPAKELPTLEVTQATVERPTAAVVGPHEQPRDTSRATIDTDPGERSRSMSPHSSRRKHHEDNTVKYCEALGIDPHILNGYDTDFDDILTSLGWNGRLNDDKRIEDLEVDIRREIGRVEATSWLGNLEHQEGKVDQLAKLIDKTIYECDELDGLLTLYAHELNTLNDDVSFIEAQSQGLQVQAANQKLLQSELQSLLKTLSISSTDLRPLKEASLDELEELKETEYALSVLYKAMLMIDSDIWQNKRRLVDVASERSSAGVYADTKMGQMRAIREKKEQYRAEIRTFLQRLFQFMSTRFKAAEQKRAGAVTNSYSDAIKLDNTARRYFRQDIWMYNAVMLFAREVSTTEWHRFIQLYEKQVKPSYQTEFQANIQAWKMEARKVTGGEQELLFTQQEKEKDSEVTKSEVITMAARKLTVKRGKTVRSAAGPRLSIGERQPGKIEPYEALSGALQETLKAISGEQNFIIQFFHMNSLISADFQELVTSSKPDERRCPDFSTRQSRDPDRGMAVKVSQVMDELFSFWLSDMQAIIDWATSTDPLQGVGILLALEVAMADLDDTNQDFIVDSLQKLQSRLVGQFNRFVDEQIRGIEETKVKINKRRGVISFMRVFPNFSATVEAMLPQSAREANDIGTSVNEAYDRINRAMWESLKFIAKEAPDQPQGVAMGAGDPEDKEALNYHILLIENMNHYIEEVDVRGLPVLQQWRDRAGEDLQEHMKLYLDAVIRRPLGRLLEFIEATEPLLTAEAPRDDVSEKLPYSRSLVKKLIGAHDNREVRRGIELLRKRVEKHFGDADDPGLSRGLVLKVLRECETRYEEAYGRTQRIIDTIYEGSLEFDWHKDDIGAMFKR